MPRKLQTSLSSFEEVDESLLHLANIMSVVQAEEAKMNDEIQSIRDRYDKLTKRSREQWAALSADIETFCIQHKDEFERTRSRDLTHGIVAFRTNPPKVSFLNRKYNLNTVIELLRKLGLAKRYLRIKEDLDKDAILADNAAKEITDEKLAACGLKIDQIESFSIEIKWDAIKD